MRKYLTQDEIERLIVAASAGLHAKRDACLIKMCFIHGFRVTELCKIQLQHLDINSKTLFVHRSKNGLSTIHPLVGSEMPFLLAWLEERKAWRDCGSDWLFLSQKGGRLSRQQVYLLFRKYGKIADIAVEPHPHMLRHACGYALADRGANTRLIQDYLGHKNIQHTVIYTASNSRRFINVWEDLTS